MDVRVNIACQSVHDIHRETSAIGPMADLEPERPYFHALIHSKEKNEYCTIEEARELARGTR